MATGEATGEAPVARAAGTADDATGAHEGVAGRLRRWLRADWRGQRALVWGAALTLLTTLVVILYYRATPAIVTDPDTPAYLRVARVIAREGKLVDPSRLPGYPLFLDLIALFTGGNPAGAAGAAQAALFIVAIVETYAIGCLVLRRAWIAFIPAALAGVNLVMLSFVKPLLTEALTMTLVATLALTVVLWVSAPSPRRLWLVALALACVFMTRPEWVYLPIPLMAALALIAWRRGEPQVTRAMLRHGALAVVALYTLVGVYVYANGALNGYYGFSDIQAFNLLGKALQYHLVGHAPARYAAIDRAMRGFAARGVNDPWQVVREYPPFQRDHFQVMSAYASAVILNNPIAFLAGCWGTLTHTLASAEPFHTLPTAGALAPLGALALATLRLMWPFLLIAPAWWLLWARRRGDSAARRLAEQMSALALLVAYDLVMTTAGGYVYFARLHTPFDPLLLLVVVGSALLAIRWAARHLLARRARQQMAAHEHEAQA